MRARGAPRASSRRDARAPRRATADVARRGATRTVARRARARAGARADATDGDASAVVVGGGVIGLTVALTLAERGMDVRVVAASFERTTSSVAAAFWFPFIVRTEPAALSDAWAIKSYEWYRELAREDGACGVEMRRCREFLKAPSPAAGWANAVEHYRALERGEHDEKYAGGYEFDVPVIAMPKFLPWLRTRCEALGVKFETRTLADVREARAFASNSERAFVVNCTGLGARRLVNDDLVKPVRGQVVYLKQDCGYGLFDDDPNALAYLIPRADCTVLGGTAQVDNDSLEPDDADERDIIAKCKRLWPELDETKVIGTNVGLRPSRTVVRCERDPADATLIHAYGHGGAGVTLCRGTALEVLALIEDA